MVKKQAEKNIVEIKGVSKSYDGQVVVKNVDLKIKKVYNIRWRFLCLLIRLTEVKNERKQRKKRRYLG